MSRHNSVATLIYKRLNQIIHWKEMMSFLRTESYGNENTLQIFKHQDSKNSNIMTCRKFRRDIQSPVQNLKHYYTFSLIDYWKEIIHDLEITEGFFSPLNMIQGKTYKMSTVLPIIFEIKSSMLINCMLTIHLRSPECFWLNVTIQLYLSTSKMFLSFRYFRSQLKVHVMEVYI